MKKLIERVKLTLYCTFCLNSQISTCNLRFQKELRAKVFKECDDTKINFFERHM